MADNYAPAPYFVDPWTTTWLPHHYPVHHHPFAHTRHALSHAFNRIGGELTNISAHPHTLTCPTVDVRESEGMFYIDVDLPGLKSRKEEGMSLKWISARTLLLRAVVKRPPTGEEKKVDEKKETAGDGGQHDDETGPFMTVHERKVGVFGRAFNFPVDVEQEGTTAKLEAGVLRIEVRKAKVEKAVEKKVEVELGGDEDVVLH